MKTDWQKLGVTVVAAVSTVAVSAGRAQGSDRCGGSWYPPAVHTDGFYDDVSVEWLRDDVYLQPVRRVVYHRPPHRRYVSYVTQPLRYRTRVHSRHVYPVSRRVRHHSVHALRFPGIRHRVSHIGFGNHGRHGRRGHRSGFRFSISRGRHHGHH